MHFHTSQDAGEGFRLKHPNPFLHTYGMAFPHHSRDNPSRATPPPRLHAPGRRNSTFALHVARNTQPPLLARGHCRSAPSSRSTPVNSSDRCCAAASAPRAGTAFHRLCSAPTCVDRDAHCRSTYRTPCTRPPLGRLLEPRSSLPAAACGRPSLPQGHVTLGRGGAACGKAPRHHTPRSHPRAWVSCSASHAATSTTTGATAHSSRTTVQAASSI